MLESIHKSAFFSENCFLSVKLCFCTCQKNLLLRLRKPISHLNFCDPQTGWFLQLCPWNVPNYLVYSEWWCWSAALSSPIYHRLKETAGEGWCLMGPDMKWDLVVLPPTSLQETVLMTQWHVRQRETFLTLLVAAAPLYGQRCRGTQNRRAGLSRSVILYLGKWEWFFPSLVLLWFSQWLSNTNHAKLHRTGSRAAHSPVLLFLALPRTPVYAKRVLHRGAEGASCQNTARTPSFSSRWDLHLHRFSLLLPSRTELGSKFLVLSQVSPAPLKKSKCQRVLLHPCSG